MRHFVALVCGAFLLHLRSALVIIVTLPLGILIALGALAAQGTSANLMSLGGIAIAIGVMVENLHKHLERVPAGAHRWEIVRLSTTEVGPALFFSLVVITVSFLPVFALSGQEGRLFRPLASTDLGGYVRAANRALAQIALPPGYTMSWSGQYEQMQHARARLSWLIPATVVLAALLLYLHFRSGVRVGLVLLCLPFSLVGGVWLVYALDYRLSVAVGFLALAGVATEFGVVMLLYLDRAREQARERRGGAPPGRFVHLGALIRGASSRVRPKAMTVAMIVGGLLPVMAGEGLGSDVMKRIAAPLVGGMLTAPLLSLIILPVIYQWWQRDRRR